MNRSKLNPVLNMANSLEIVLTPLPADIVSQANAYYGRPVTRGDMVAYIRHNYTNYDTLMKRVNTYRERQGYGSRTSWQAHNLLRWRASCLAERALTQIEKNGQRAAGGGDGLNFGRV